MTELAGALEMMLGGGLMLLGVAMLVWWLLPHRGHRRLDVLAVLLAVVALVEARKRP